MELVSLPDDAVDTPRRGRIMCQLMSSLLVCGGLSGQRSHRWLKRWLASSHSCLPSRCFLDDAKAGRLTTLGVGEPPPENSVLSVDGLPELPQELPEGTYPEPGPRMGLSTLSWESDSSTSAAGAAGACSWRVADAAASMSSIIGDEHVEVEGVMHCGERGFSAVPLNN